MTRDQSTTASKSPGRSWNQTVHPLAGSGFRLLSDLCRRYGTGEEDRRVLWKCRAVNLPAIPFCLLDQLKSGRRLAKHQFDRPPIFLIGHWRSGTTHLQNLFACDEQFGMLTMFHCMTVKSCFSAPKLLRLLMRKQAPPTRPMDSVHVDLDSPQEEDLALSRMSPWSYFHAYHFPQRAREVFRQTVLLESTDAVTGWQRDYSHLLKRISLLQQGKQLCLKNPPNTARIPSLLELFPDAKFVHIVRHPLTVFLSTVRMWQKILDVLALHPFDRRDLRGLVTEFQQKLMQRYLDTVDDIPAGQLVEVRYEELERSPMEQMQRIYDELSLCGFESAKPAIERYLESLGDFRKNTYHPNDEDLRHARESFAPILEHWNYDLSSESF